MKNFFNNTKIKKPYIVAELNTSHFGDINLAKKMILKAKEVGCDCVKLQSWTPDTLYSDNFFKKNPIQKRFFQKYSLSENQLKILARFSKKKKIDFSSTPYANREVDFLINECNPAFIKIASMDLNNYPFLEHISAKNNAIVLSTGMGTEREIVKAVKILRKNGNKKIVLLHCVSLYPTPKKLTNLNNLIGFKKKFPGINIGYSDHTEGIEFAIGAVALGAVLIEKHFTLDKKIIGMDNHMALEPKEMKTLVESCNNIFMGLGGTVRSLSKPELKQIKKMRRSVIINKNKKKGSIISEQDIELKRPGTGVPANDLEKIIAKKLKKNISSGQLLTMKHIE